VRSLSRAQVCKTQGVVSFPELPAGVVIVTAEERPGLWSTSAPLFESIWPAYNMHGDVAGEYFGALVPRFADLQFLLYDERRARAVARGRTIPFAWDGSLKALPAGIDALGVQAVHDDRPPTALSALAAEVAPDRQNQGLSRVVIQTMAALAAQHELTALVAPVRPSWKARYPITPIAEYAAWRRGDGLPFDPWMRVHARLGGQVLRPEPRSMRITASIEQWEAWTGLALPSDGRYVFPAGLAPLEVRAGHGEYWEPNVWMRHEV
jgi:GNAT superfamily N-acetyltransferase